MFTGTSKTGDRSEADLSSSPPASTIAVLGSNSFSSRLVGSSMIGLIVWQQGFGVQAFGRQGGV